MTNLAVCIFRTKFKAMVTPVGKLLDEQDIAQL